MDSIPPCDGMSVGIIARDGDGRVLMLKRKKFPFGYAPPAGHCDGLSYPVACFKEFNEETGLHIIGAPRPRPLLRNAKTETTCRRGRTGHFWQVFEVDWKGELELNRDESEWLGWMSREELVEKANRTLRYLGSLKLAERAEDIRLVSVIKNAIEAAWREDPGLEVVWLDIFRELEII